MYGLMLTDKRSLTKLPKIVSAGSAGGLPTYRKQCPDLPRYGILLIGDRVSMVEPEYSAPHQRNRQGGGSRELPARRACPWQQPGAGAKLRSMPCRGVRGATTVDRNERDEILAATRQLVALMIRQNGIRHEDVGSAIFTTTPDLDAEFPALAARQLGWLDVPLLCSHEMAVPGALTKCIRVLINWNTDQPQDAIQHIYIRDAVQLRPDRSKLPPVDWEELEAWIAEQMGKPAD